MTITLCMKLTALIVTSVNIGESGRRLGERILDHAGRDKNLHVLEHSLKNGHKEISMENITLLIKSYKDYFKPKVLGLYILERESHPLMHRIIQFL